MPSLYKFSFLLILIFGMTPAFALHHFTEVYEANGVWRVDHFQVSPGKLQDLKESRTFGYRHQAQAYAQKIKQLQPKTAVKFVKTESQKPLWIAENTWSHDWEIKYGEWIAQNFKSDFFVKYSLETDCADVAYSLRWIFARIHSLPAAATLAGSGAVFTHLSAKAEWDNLPTDEAWHKDQRFIASLNWLLDHVFTGTLAKDGYPVKISREMIRPGLINLLGGHTEVFNQVSYDPAEVPLMILNSTMPKMVRHLATRVFLDPSPYYAPQDGGGLLQFRWPVKKGNDWEMVPKEEMPHYSLEQFDKNLCENESRFAFCLFEKLGMSFNEDLIFAKILENITHDIQSRQNIVNDGYKFCQQTDCAPGTEAYENWSTPSRDKRLLKGGLEYKSLMSSLGKGSQFYQWLNETKFNIQEDKISYSDFYERLKLGFTSYDPRDAIAARWALNDEVITQTVSAKLKSAEIARNEIVSMASSCRNNPDQCQRSEATYEQLSSADIDFQMRSLIHNWKQNCLWNDNGCPANQVIDQLYAKIWFRSPAPWDSLEQRMGDLNSAQEGHVLAATSVVPAGDKFLMLDGFYPYEIATRNRLKIPKNLKLSTFHQGSGQFIEFNGENFTYRDSERATKEVVSSQIRPPTGVSIHDFGSNWLFIYFYTTGHTPSPTPNDREQVGFFVDVKNHTESAAIGFNAIHFDYENKGTILLQGETNRLFSATGNSLQEKDLPGLEGVIKNFLVINQDEFLFNLNVSSTNFLKWYRKSEWHNYLSSKNGFGLSWLNNNFIKINSYDLSADKNTLIIDRHGKEYFSWQNVRSLGSIGSGTNLLLVGETETNFRAWLMQESKLTSTGLTILIEDEYFSPVISANADWISLFTDNGFEIFDFEGNLLERPTSMKSSCTYYLTDRKCSEKAGHLLAESFQFTTAENIYYTRFGSAQGLAMGEVYAYLLTQETDDDSPMNQTFVWSETGMGMGLMSGLMLWMPQK